jgi:hypothetical protein
MSVLKVFCNQIQDFIEDVERVLPNDKDIRRARTAIEALKKANPKLLILGWKTHVADKYGETIMAGNVDFFLEKDYAEDVSGDGSILEAINRLKDPIRSIDAANMAKVIKYIQNLTQLSTMYSA